MEKDLAHRFIQNPLLSPKDLLASQKELTIACLLNPGVFVFQEKIWLIIRVAERPVQKEGFISFPVLALSRKVSIRDEFRKKVKSNSAYKNNIEVLKIDLNDPALISIDSRVINYKGEDYLTTVSHFRLLCSEDGIDFQEAEGYPYLYGLSILESFGVEDCRVVFIKNNYRIKCGFYFLI